MRRKSWNKAQSALEYFIIFAVIACVVIPLWKGTAFSGIRDSGKGFFAACTDRILKEAELVGPEGPAEVTIIRNFPNCFGPNSSSGCDYTRFGMVIKDNSCDVTIKIGRSKQTLETIEFTDLKPCSYDTAPGYTSEGHCAAPVWYSGDYGLGSGDDYWWEIVDVSPGIVSGKTSDKMCYRGN